MIDTINFRLHDLDKYMDQFESILRGKNMSVGIRSYCSVDFGAREVEFSRHKFTSGDYQILFQINYTQKYVQFELSIPKFLFGHNFKHFPHEMESVQNSTHVYTQLIEFLSFFFLQEFFVKLDFQDLELMRIDFCINYQFESTVNFNAYLSALPDIISRQFGKGSKIVKHETGVSYSVLDWSFKFYDKLVEYNNNKKKLKRLNFENFGNTLRFEITLRKNKLNDLYHTLPYDPKQAFRYNKRRLELKKVYNDVNSLLARFATIYNSHTMDTDLLNSKLLKLCGLALFKKYSKIDFESLFDYYNHNDFIGNVVKSPTDFGFFIRKTANDDYKEYLKLISPKPLFFQLSNFERVMQRTTSEVQKLEISQDLFSTWFLFFTNFLHSLIRINVSEHSSLKILYYKKTEILKFISIRKYNNLNKYFSVMKTGDVTKTYARSSLSDINRTLLDLESCGISLNNFSLKENFCFDEKNYLHFQKIQV